MSMKDFIETLTVEQKKALMEALIGSDTENVQNTEITSSINITDNKNHISEDFIVKKNNNITNNKKREPVRAKQNQWVDTGEGKDIVTPSTNRTPRNRTPPKKINTKCYVCGKSFDADSRFVFGEYHRCDRCK